MTRFLADENTSKDLVRGILRRSTGIDICRLKDRGLQGATDPDVLEAASREGRVLVTQDVRTMPAHAWDRVRRGLAMAGMIVVPQSLSLGDAIDEILILGECLVDDEWRDQVIYLPL